VTHFSYLGPVRHGFVATDKASGKSKGVGYVTYALKEDAEQALLELDNKDFGGNGRKIRVGWATARPGTLERIKKAEIAAEDPAKVVQPGLKIKAIKEEDEATAGGDDNKDPKAIRTVVVSGLPEVTKAVLWKKVRKVNEGIEVIFPVDGQDGVAHLVFPSHGEAVKGIGKLHGHTYKEKIVSAVLKKRAEKLGMGQGAGKGISHAGRLIVRNLAWNVSSSHGLS
jgi:nucleolar protein 4